MNKRLRCAAAVLALLLWTGSVWADAWDAASESDDDSDTDNVLLHGAVQVHDLAAKAGPVADEDWYIVPVPPYSSVEVIVDGVTGDLFSSGALTLSQRSSTGAIFQLSTQVYGETTARRLSLRNITGSVVRTYVRVGDAGCSTTCTSSDQYTIRLRETHVSLARFNNSGSQVTVLLTQNPSTEIINAIAYFWSAAGALLATQPISNLGPKQLSVLQTQTIVGGQSGSITISHDGPHGGINAKAVALEPATGFSFDTPGVIRH